MSSRLPVRCRNCSHALETPLSVGYFKLPFFSLRVHRRNILQYLINIYKMDISTHLRRRKVINDSSYISKITNCVILRRVGCELFSAIATLQKILVHPSRCFHCLHRLCSNPRTVWFTIRTFLAGED